MNLKIKTKLAVLLCVPLITISAFFITSLINTENSVLEAENNNVSEKVAKLLNDNLKGQVDTVTRSLSDYYENSFHQLPSEFTLPLVKTLNPYLLSSFEMMPNSLKAFTDLCNSFQ